MSINFKQQLQKNLVAVISVMIAILALSYNSWRNELSEDNRNVRAAGFEIMRESARLQYFIDSTTYSESANDGDVIQGWVSINLILSLSKLMSPKIHERASNLKNVWTSQWSTLATDNNANEAVTRANDQLVESVREHLRQLR